MTRSIQLALFVVIVAFDTINGIKRNDSKGIKKKNLKDVLSILTAENLIENYNKNSSYGLNEINSFGLNEICARDLILLKEAISTDKIWAQEMLDASSRVPSGILKGNIIDLGMYDECLEVRGKSLNIEIRGRPCMYIINVTENYSKLPINPTLSICMPASCDSQDVSYIISEAINKTEDFKGAGIRVISTRCLSMEKEPHSMRFKIATLIFLCLISFLSVCTFFDLKYTKLEIGKCKHSTVERFAKFSFRRNAAAIFSLEMKEDYLPAVHGLKGLNIIYVLIGHEYIMALFSSHVNFQDMMDFITSEKSFLAFSTNYAMDSYFCLSGFLLSYSFLKNITEQKKFSIFKYYFHRFLRLAPSVIVLIVITIVFVPKFGSGARWDMLMDSIVSTNCRSKWWSTLLYVQNLVDEENLCLAHLWLLSADMQLFWISPLVLYPLYRKPKLGLVILSVLLAVSIIIPISIVMIKELPVLSFVNEKKIAVTIRVFTSFYMKTYNRATPWLVGIFLGYELASRKRKLECVSLTSGWLIAIWARVFCSSSVNISFDPNNKFDLFWEAFFYASSRAIWAASQCWIIFVSVSGQDGIVSKIFCAKFFLPLSRLSYSMYLVHIIIQIMHTASLRTAQYFSVYYIIRSFFNTFVISFIVALLFNLCFESPFMILGKMLTEKNQKIRLKEFKKS